MPVGPGNRTLDDLSRESLGISGNDQGKIVVDWYAAKRNSHENYYSRSGFDSRDQFIDGVRTSGRWRGRGRQYGRRSGHRCGGGLLRQRKQLNGYDWSKHFDRCEQWHRYRHQSHRVYSRGHAVVSAGSGIDNQTLTRFAISHQKASPASLRGFAFAALILWKMVRRS
jgi:hypothetical protein